MKNLTGKLMVLVILICGVLGCDNNAELLPGAARTSLTEAWPDAAIKKVKQNQAGDLTLYEVDLKQSKHKSEVTLAADGTILDIEEHLPASSVPDAVAAAFFKASGGAKPWQIEREEVRAMIQNGKVVALDSPTVVYELTYLKWVVVPREIELTPEGKILKDD